jgi:hypothetical protein
MKKQIINLLKKNPLIYNLALYFYNLIRKNPYGTHKIIVKKVLKNLSKEIKHLTIVEVGSGESSSPIFAKFAKNKNHFFYSFETNKKYFLEIIKKIKIENTKEYCVNIKFLENYNLVKEFKNSIDLLFIDSAPWESRVEILSYFKDKAKIIIIHDCDYFPNNKIFGKLVRPVKNANDTGYRDYNDVFSSWYEYFPKRFHCASGPPTLIGSNILDVNKYI